MVDRNLIQSLKVSDEDVEKQISEAFEGQFSDEMLDEMVKAKTSHEPGAILTGHVVNILGDEVVIEVGLKSEGSVHLNEFSDPEKIEIGQEVEVLLEEVESDSGLVVLSKRKADRIRGWERILATNNEGDIITGVVTRKIKGGMLVDIGVPAFLPASQVDIRRPHDIAEFIGREIEAKILKIDEARRNIVISRRKLIEEQREGAKERILSEIEVGQLVKGVVKNIADFGVFIDLGGIDGLLHITDMSWGRIGHPSEVLKINDDVETIVLNVDREKEKIALGLKQRTASPWDKVEEKYSVGSRIKGTVVNIVSYGAFVKLEDGLEGLVHISEMSWTRRINNPAEIVSVGEEVEIVVLEINKEKHEISLGIKQAEANPWMVVKEKYPPGTLITGIVRTMTNFGAFVEIEEGIDGLLHVSDLSWTRKIGHASELLKKGQEIQTVVLSVDEEKMRVSLGYKQLSEDPWLRIIPEHYLPGQIVKGKVTKITNFGVFIELEDDLEGLLHISELADHKVDNPQDIVEVGQELEVKILRVDSEERKIGLSLKRAQWAAEEGQEDQAQLPEEPVRRRGGLEDDTGLLGSMEGHVVQSSADQQEATEPAEPETDEAPEAKKAEEAEEPAETPEAEAPAAEEEATEEAAEPTEPKDSIEPEKADEADEPAEPEKPEEPQEPEESKKASEDVTEQAEEDKPKVDEETEAEAEDEAKADADAEKPSDEEDKE